MGLKRQIQLQEVINNDKKKKKKKKYRNDWSQSSDNIICIFLKAYIFVINALAGQFGKFGRKLFKVWLISMSEAISNIPLSLNFFPHLPTRRIPEF